MFAGAINRIPRISRATSGATLAGHRPADRPDARRLWWRLGRGSGPASSNPSTTTSLPAPSSSAPPSADACATAPVTVSGPSGQSTLVEGADFATALAWAPDGRLFFAERAGTIKIASGPSVRTFTTVPTVTSDRTGVYSERGLLGLALSPDFAVDHFVYAFYSRDDGTTQAVVRFTECAGVASDETTLVTLPSGDDCCHKGGRLAFGKDGKLYVTLGDEHTVGRATVGSESSVPQDPNDVRGKILRYEPDGSIPSDNPFGPSSRSGSAACATRSGSRSTTTGTRSSRRTGPRVTSARRPPDTTSRSGSSPARGTSGRPATATRTSCPARRRASADQSPSGAAKRRRSSRPARRGSTNAVRPQLRATSCSAARAGCGSSHRALPTPP